MEIWKDIEGYENHYQISNLGNVKSLSRKLKTKHSFRVTKEMLLKVTIDAYGYGVVCLSKEMKIKRCRVHRLVAQAFISNMENKPHVNHIDGVKTNNYFGNLEWCTPQENINHAMATGLTDGMNGSILTIGQVVEIKKMLSSGAMHKDIAQLFNVTRGAITDINIGKSWKNV